MPDIMTPDLVRGSFGPWYQGRMLRLEPISHTQGGGWQVSGQTEVDGQHIDVKLSMGEKGLLTMRFKSQRLGLEAMGETPMDIEVQYRMTQRGLERVNQVLWHRKDGGFETDELPSRENSTLGFMDEFAGRLFIAQAGQLLGSRAGKF